MEASVLTRRNNGVDLPKDFPECLERFREVSGLSWGELAASLGVDHERLTSWRRGALPRDLALPKLYRVAQRVPGGMGALFSNIVDVLGDEE